MSMFINGVHIDLFGSEDDLMGVNVEIAGRVFGPFGSNAEATEFISKFLSFHHIRSN